MVYSRVSGVQHGATWTGRLTDPGQSSLAMSRDLFQAVAKTNLKNLV
jgi:hypothetical protein